MAENTSKFTNAVTALFEGVETFAKSKTVVGEPIVVDDTTIIPLVDISIGMGANAALNADKKKNSESGAMGAKMSPTALLIIRDGSSRVINIKDQGPAMKAIDMIPEVVNRFTAKTKIRNKKEAEAVNEAKK